MTKGQQRRWNLIAITSVVVAAILAISAITWIDYPQVPNRDTLRLSSASRALITRAELLPASGWSRLQGDVLTPAEQQQDQKELQQAPYQIQTGIYATSTSELNLNVPSYNGNGYIWFRWQQPFQNYLERTESTIGQRMVLLNRLISDADPALQAIGEKPEKMEDGSYYQLFTFKGRYYINKASFRHYPFMTVSLPLALEPDDVDGQLDYTQLRLEPDIQNSGMGLYAKIIGWLNHGWSIAEYRHHYATNFGLGGPESDYSQVLFEISFGTSAWASFWRFLLPLAVVMSMVLLVFKVRADEQDARASIPVTVLLTLVFLQQGYRSQLPDLPFLTFLDQVYVVAYVVTLVAFVLVIWIGRRYESMEQLPEGPAKQLLLQRLDRLDVVWPMLVVVLGAGAIVACWLTLPAGG
jgi:hypothetical protein